MSKVEPVIRHHVIRADSPDELERAFDGLDIPPGIQRHMIMEMRACMIRERARCFVRRAVLWVVAPVVWFTLGWFAGSP